MTWIRVDDHFDEHPKFARAGPLGVALWLAGLAYCNRNLTDGFIPWAKAQTLLSWEFLGPQINQEGMHEVVTIAVTSGMSGTDVDGDYVAGLLCGAGLWIQVDGGYRIHDYLEYQPSKEAVQRERARNAERQGRYRNAGSNAVTDAGSNTVNNGANNGANNGTSHTVSNTGPVPKPVPVPGTKPKPGRDDPSGANAPSPQGAKRRRVTIADDDFREELVLKFTETFGSREAVVDVINTAMNHTARLKCSDEQAYLRGWVARDAARVPGHHNGHAAPPVPTECECGVLLANLRINPNSRRECPVHGWLEVPIS